MDKFTAAISLKQPNKTKAGKPYLTFFFNNDMKYNVFDSFYDKFNVGDVVDVTLERNGAYMNLTDMQLSTGQATIASNKPIEKTFHLTVEQVRTNALNAAISCSVMPIDDPAKLGALLILANNFVKYINGSADN